MCLRSCTQDHGRIDVFLRVWRVNLNDPNTNMHALVRKEIMWQVDWNVPRWIP